ncbi:MAG: MMPL family transporter [Thermomicrobiales bacterium]
MSIAEISRFVLRHKLAVVLFWVIVTVAAVGAAGPASGALSERFDLPGSESTEVNVALAEQYGTGGFASPLVAVVTLPEGTTVDSPGVTDELTAAFDQVAEAVPQARIVSYASTGNDDFVGEDGRTTFGLIYTSDFGMDESPDVDVVKSALADATVAGVPFRFTGAGELAAVTEGEEGDDGVLIETLVGAGGALLVLLWVYGSFLAILPVVMAGIAILTSFLLTWGLTTVTDVSFIVQFLIALVGLGIAIDYSLLLVTRWREERAAGHDNETAVQRAMETAGHAVIFSGTTVGISLLALVALPVPFLRSVGLGGMLIPLVSVAVAITLLPVLLATAGPRLDWPRFRKGDQVSHIWERWARFIVHHRGLAVIAGVAIIAALVIPAFSLQLGSGSGWTLATTGEAADTRRVLDDAGVSQGVLTPYEVLVEGSDPAAAAAALGDVAGIDGVTAPDGANWRQGETAVVLAFPAADGSTSDGRDLLERARDTAHDLPGQVRIGGATAGDADFIDAVYGNFPLMLALIVVVTFVLLVRAFRSILLPLKAVILNCVSVGAAYGVLVLVWQEGFGSDLLFGIESVDAVSSWLPLMVFAFLFGLSMDYEVFILARMREEYDKTGSTAAAVVRGMSHTARLVTTAAVILFLAFVSMAAVPETDVKIMATAMAAGILLDATIVRGLLVPATVALMGRWNWWLPSWLDRFVPKPATVAEQSPATVSSHAG